MNTGNRPPNIRKWLGGRLFQLFWLWVSEVVEEVEHAVGHLFEAVGNGIKHALRVGRGDDDIFVEVEANRVEFGLYVCFFMAVSSPS